MEHTLIKTENYLIVVSDEEIQNKDWFFEKAGRLGPICYTKGKINLHMKKIIAHLPINGAPYLEGIDLLPTISKEDAKKLAIEHSESELSMYPETSSTLTESEVLRLRSLIQAHSYRGFEKGFNKAMELNKDKVFTLEDVKKAINWAWRKTDREEHILIIDEDEFIQSLQQPKLPIAFERETEQYTVAEMSFLPLGTVNQKPKTITNSEGRTQWVGTYIF